MESVEDIIKALIDFINKLKMEDETIKSSLYRTKRQILEEMDGEK